MGDGAKSPISVVLLSAILLFQVATMGGFVQPAEAFEKDTHYYMTFYLALKSGFTYDEAHLIASGNWRQDETSNVAGGDFWGPFMGKLQSFLIPKLGDWRIQLEIGEHDLTGRLTIAYDQQDNQRWHALNLDEGKKQSRNIELVNRAIDENDLTLKLVKFGQFLHFNQDVYSHAGFESSRGHEEVYHAADSPGYDGVGSKDDGGFYTVDESGNVKFIEKEKPGDRYRSAVKDTLRHMIYVLERLPDRHPNDVSYSDVEPLVEEIISQSTPISNSDDNLGTNLNIQAINREVARIILTPSEFNIWKKNPTESIADVIPGQIFEIDIFSENEKTGERKKIANRGDPLPGTWGAGEDKSLTQAYLFKKPDGTFQLIISHDSPEVLQGIVVINPLGTQLKFIQSSHSWMPSPTEGNVMALVAKDDSLKRITGKVFSSIEFESDNLSKLNFALFGNLQRIIKIGELIPNDLKPLEDPFKKIEKGELKPSFNFPKESILVPIDTEKNKEVSLLPISFKKPAKDWREGYISDSKFLNAIKTLVVNGIIKVPESAQTTLANAKEDARVVPFAKKIFKWWEEDKIDDKTIVLGIGNLITNGFFVQSPTSTEKIPPGKPVFDPSTSLSSQAYNPFAKTPEVRIDQMKWCDSNAGYLRLLVTSTSNSSPVSHTVDVTPTSGSLSGPNSQNFPQDQTVRSEGKGNQLVNSNMEFHNTSDKEITVIVQIFSMNPFKDNFIELTKKVPPKDCKDFQNAKKDSVVIIEGDTQTIIKPTDPIIVPPPIGDPSKPVVITSEEPLLPTPATELFKGFQFKVKPESPTPLVIDMDKIKPVAWKKIEIGVGHAEKRLLDFEVKGETKDDSIATFKEKDGKVSFQMNKGFKKQDAFVLCKNPGDTILVLKIKRGDAFSNYFALKEVPIKCIKSTSAVADAAKDDEKNPIVRTPKEPKEPKEPKNYCLTLKPPWKLISKTSRSDLYESPDGKIRIELINPCGPGRTQVVTDSNGVRIIWTGSQWERVYVEGKSTPASDITTGFPPFDWEEGEKTESEPVTYYSRLDSECLIPSDPGWNWQEISYDPSTGSRTYSSSTYHVFLEIGPLPDCNKKIIDGTGAVISWSDGKWIRTWQDGATDDATDMIEVPAPSFQHQGPSQTTEKPPSTITNDKPKTQKKNNLSMSISPTISRFVDEKWTVSVTITNLSEKLLQSIQVIFTDDPTKVIVFAPDPGQKDRTKALDYKPGQIRTFPYSKMKCTIEATGQHGAFLLTPDGRIDFDPVFVKCNPPVLKPKTPGTSPDKGDIAGTDPCEDVTQKSSTPYGYFQHHSLVRSSDGNEITIKQPVTVIWPDSRPADCVKVTALLENPITRQTITTVVTTNSDGVAVLTFDVPNKATSFILSVNQMSHGGVSHTAYLVKSLSTTDVAAGGGQTVKTP